jgi:hypothetical protein
MVVKIDLANNGIGKIESVVDKMLDVMITKFGYSPLKNENID